MSEPHENHLQVAHQVLSYLKNTIGQGLLFIQLPLIYTYVDYASSVVDRRSTSGYCTLLAVASSLGIVKNKKWWQDRVRRPSSVPWYMV